MMIEAIGQLMRIGPSSLIFKELRKWSYTIVKGQFALFLQINKSWNLPVAVYHKSGPTSGEQGDHGSVARVFRHQAVFRAIGNLLEGLRSLIWNVVKTQLTPLQEIAVLLSEKGIPDAP